MSFTFSFSQALYKEKLSTNVNLNINNSTYDVVFDGNGATSGSTSSVTCTYNSNCTLTKNGFYKTGHIFVGWATSSNGTKIYDDEDTVFNLLITGEYKLYAVWRQVWAVDLSYDNTNTGLDCDEIQCALDEINNIIHGNN